MPTLSNQNLAILAAYACRCIARVEILRVHNSLRVCPRPVRERKWSDRFQAALEINHNSRIATLPSHSIKLTENEA